MKFSDAGEALIYLKDGDCQASWVSKSYLVSLAPMDNWLNKAKKHGYRYHYDVKRNKKAVLQNLTVNVQDVAVGPASNRGRSTRRIA